MNTKSLNYLELAKTPLSISLATRTAHKRADPAEQILTALHEAVHFVIEVADGADPHAVFVTNASAAHTLGCYGQGQCCTWINIDEGGYNSYMAAYIFELFFGRYTGTYFHAKAELNCLKEELDVLVQNPDERNAYYKRTSKETMNRLMGLWPLIYVSAIAFLNHRSKKRDGRVEEWVLFDLQRLIKACLEDKSLVINTKDNLEIVVDYNSLFVNTPKFLDVLEWFCSLNGECEVNEKYDMVLAKALVRYGDYFASV